MFTLHNNIEVPSIGLGTSPWDEDTFHNTVEHALDLNYKMIDTARSYGNEHIIGGALANTPREDAWLTSKVPKTENGYYSTLDAFEQSLAHLRTDYTDCYLVHWPHPDLDLWCDSWRALEFLYSRGYTKTIGVCNTKVKELEYLLNTCTVTPHILQIECHPLWQQRELRALCAQHGIHLQAARPLASGALLDNEQYCKLAHSIGIDPIALAIQWLLSKGCSLVAGSSNPAHLAANMHAAQHTLDPAHVALVDELDGIVEHPVEVDLRVRPGYRVYLLR